MAKLQKSLRSVAILNAIFGRPVPACVTEWRIKRDILDFVFALRKSAGRESGATLANCTKIEMKNKQFPHLETIKRFQYSGKRQKPDDSSPSGFKINSMPGHLHILFHNF
jgi:hypothetical protein